MPVLLIRYEKVNYSSVVTPEVFESHLSLLERFGFEPVSLSSVYDYVAGEGDLPDRCVHLTFDYGYADVFVYVYPIVKRHGFLASVFPVVSKIFSGSRRATFDELVEVGLSNRVDELFKQSEYVGWEELKEMLDAGFFEVGSNSLTHRACFSSDKIVGFSDLGVGEWFYELTGDRRLGIPIYEWKWDCAVECVHDDADIRDAMSEYVRSKGGVLFLRKKESRSMLMKEYKRLRRKMKTSFEREPGGNRFNRLEREISSSRAIMEENLGCKVDFFSYPWGDFDEIVVSFLKSVGYRGAVTLKEGLNMRGTDPYLMRRITAKGGDEWLERIVRVLKRDILTFVFSKMSG